MLRRPLTEITLQPSDMEELDMSAMLLWEKKNNALAEEIGSTPNANPTTNDVFSPPVKKISVHERLGYTGNDSTSGSTSNFHFPQ